MIGNQPTAAGSSSSQITTRAQFVQKTARLGERDDGIKNLIIERGLRPLGNKKRLAFVEGETCNASLALFADRASAERYYDTFVQYARRNPPPVVIETMVAFVPKIVYAEKYAFIYPYDGVVARPEYRRWAQDATRACNKTLRPHNYTAGEYACVPSNVEVVLRWDILLPRRFKLDSPEAQELLSDPPDEGFRPMQVVGQEAIPRNSQDQMERRKMP